MANSIVKLQNKKTKTVVGISSGTSADGIDTVLLKIRGSGIHTDIKILDFVTYNISYRVKKAILKNSDDETAKLSEVCRLNVILGRMFSDSVRKICRKNSLIRNGRLHLDFIGSHGQTIHHLPQQVNYLGYKMKSTLQIGDPSIIANLTGVTTIGDFRIADCASGGDGAPLVPYLDYILFKSNYMNRGLLNIGGIANITVIPKSGTKKDIIAFDTGPGNMLLDGLMQTLYKKKYDRDGHVASKGDIDYKLFKWLMQDKYYKRHPPKSTGRERYGLEFQREILSVVRKIKKENIIKTVTEYSAYTIGYSYHKFIKPFCVLDELIISGGGAKNKELIRLIKNYLIEMQIKQIDDSGVTADSKEAVLFAVLANECIASNSANIRSATGAKKNAILGKVCLASGVV